MTAKKGGAVVFVATGNRPSSTHELTVNITALVAVLPAYNGRVKGCELCP